MYLMVCVLCGAVAIGFASWAGAVTVFLFSSFFSVSLLATLAYVLNTELSPRETLTASIAVTLLFIAGYALIYSVAQGPCATTCVTTFGESLYFSVVTATTLGYGDFAPNLTTRFTAAGQAVTGYLFLGYALAILIRR